MEEVYLMPLYIVGGFMILIIFCRPYILNNENSGAMYSLEQEEPREPFLSFQQEELVEEDEEPTIVEM